MKLLLKFLGLAPSDRFLLFIAFLLLLAIRLGLWLLPFKVLLRGLGKISNTSPQMHPASSDDLDKVSWAVNQASRLMPKVKCLARALTAQVLLRWRGCCADLRIGVAKSESGKLEAHAWVESQGRIIVGSLADLSRYTPLPSLEV